MMLSMLSGSSARCRAGCCGVVRCHMRSAMHLMPWRSGWSMQHAICGRTRQIAEEKQRDDLRYVLLTSVALSVASCVPSPAERVDTPVSAVGHDCDQTW